MKKVAVIGHFGFGMECLDGQTVKTKILTKALCDRFGERFVLKMDTHGWSKKPIRFFCEVFGTTKKAENVLILPAQNGLRVIVPLLAISSWFHKQCRLHYSVIGGWLPAFLQNHSRLKKWLSRFTGIYVETHGMKADLEEQGVSNVYVMPNCKELKILATEELVMDHQEPYKLCTFSRVMQEKGIADVVTAVKAVNERLGRTVFILDIYGQVAQDQTEWFDQLQREFTEGIRYCGAVPFDRSVDVLKNYFALLFPTRFYTEGIPGTVIDAYAAGLPVIASEWENFAEMIEHGVTGYGYSFDDVHALSDILLEVALAPHKILSLKNNCLQRAERYLPQQVIDVLRLDGEEDAICGQ